MDNRNDEINFESDLDLLIEQEAFDLEPVAEEAVETAPVEAEPAAEEPVEQEKPRHKLPKFEMPKAKSKPKREKRERPKFESEMQEKPQSETAAVGKFQSAPARPQRRPRMSKQDMFKQSTLPVIIVGVALLLILVFIIGSITRAVQKNKIEKEASIAVSESIAEEQARLEAEMNSILENADRMAAGYDFDGAVALIDTFSGNIGGYPKLQDARARYEYSKEALVPWEDPNTIINLSFQTLIADTERAYSNEEYGSSLKKNFISVTEFQKVLERLYENNYVLVGLDDFIESGTEESGVSYYTYKPLYLPEGKKPVVLTQTNVNYNLYLVDSDDDMIADKGGVGIASKMVLGADGKVTCEIVNADGTVSTGAYDLVPILDAFVEEHPDFSYHGSKAVLALTGYNGLFGYRTHAAARATFGEEQYEKDVATIQALAKKLTETGYQLACYTYGNCSFGKYSISQIQSDISKWNDEVVPILGNIDTLVLAQNSDIGSGMLYSGEKYNYLKSAGFNYYIGYCAEGDPFTFIADEYVRQGRLIVSGSNIKNNSKWFNGIFETKDLLDEVRKPAATTE